MAPLQWSDALSHDLPFMDRAHQRFVSLLALVDAADDKQLERAWRALVEYTSDLFALEDERMEATRFASRNGHSLQHRVVLEVMCEGLVQAGEGRLLQVREMARQLAGWYVGHVRTMDAALALHLRGVGLDSAAGGMPAQPGLNAEARTSAPPHQRTLPAPSRRRSTAASSRSF